ncbi:hypothetical protein BO82DRAFT_66601 [Aspergillus uvarum CBS 121591]|uniref:Uncharacterized protein n=1 Tax=Aspergillus uvarum CBS 121591 TaxID=1448315 RepID=A0A319D354_9EURO|nr:hypothetical protein BO82DRAFT_66601 [Aspergillus uvarum CBS 121591]PYH82368.1 hypothetical protein BO82DRAFT_66601 [Aspergillus uvarum CBS 121591]
MMQATGAKWSFFSCSSSTAGPTSRQGRGWRSASRTRFHFALSPPLIAWTLLKYLGVLSGTMIKGGGGKGRTKEQEQERERATIEHVRGSLRSGRVPDLYSLHSASGEGDYSVDISAGRRQPEMNTEPVGRVRRSDLLSIVGLAGQVLWK